MSRMKNYEDIMIEIMEEYNKDPDGWTFLVDDGDSKTGRNKMYFSNNKDTWYVETYKYNPHKLKGKGIKFEDTDISEEVDPSISSGIRPLTKEKLQEFMEKGKIGKKEIKEIMNNSPKSRDELEEWDEANGLLGPFYRSSDLDLGNLSKSQKEIQKKLQKEVDRLENKELSYIR